MDANRRLQLLKDFFKGRTIETSLGEYNANYQDLERFYVSDVSLLNDGIAEVVRGGLIDTSQWLDG